MNYASAITDLFSINKQGMKLGLETMQNALKALGSPQNAFRSIHIAGTNGKGSVSTKIAAALTHSGNKTGLYTSPHISSFRERIQINEELILEKNVIKYLQQIQKLKIPTTFFETATLLAFLHFASENVDDAVIETGIGGRLDATNVIFPSVSVITSIGYDHMEILGHSIEEITYEKAGIIKDSIPIIIGPNVPRQKIEFMALQKNSQLIQVEGEFATYDEENSAIAELTLKTLGVPLKSIQIGCQKRPFCRIEEITRFPYPIILDVAHNPDGLQALFRSLKHLYPHQDFSVIAGFSDSKDISRCLKILSQKASHLYLVQAKHRGTPTSILARLLDKEAFSRYTVSGSIKEAINQNKGPVVICGTFFIMQEAREALGLHYPSDKLELNETFKKDSSNLCVKNSLLP